MEGRRTPTPRLGATLKGSFALGLGLALACGVDPDKYKVESAYCNACGNTAFTVDDCKRIANDNKCEEYSLDAPTLESCHNSCSFKRCVEDGVLNSCGGGLDQTRTPDPKCAEQTRGMFTQPPACKLEPHVVEGQTVYVCDCNDRCPCGLHCGLIPEIDPNRDQYCTE